jgi:DNA repair protein RadD
MHIFPTDEEVEITVELLIDKYKMTPQLIGKLFNITQRDQANSVLKSLGGKQLSTPDVTRLLVQREGPALFGGSEDETRELRFHLLKMLPDDVVKALFERNPQPNKNVTSSSHIRRCLAEKKWTSGKQWAKDFVMTLGFPTIFAGVFESNRVDTIETVRPLDVPPRLADFQETLKRRMLTVLTRDGDKTRCVVTLPTGGGKTRVAVEAFIDWMHPRFAAGKYLIWIAQSEELCEQAIACIKQLWGARPFVGSLLVYRYFGGRDISEETLHGGAVVASIQQLYNRIKNGDCVVDKILKDTGAMIIDEAHRAITPMYDLLFTKAKAICGENLFPICGLTATPGRAGLNQAQDTVKLVGQFEYYLIKPDLGAEYENDPLRYFREHEYLARAHHILFKPEGEYTLTDDEVAQLDREEDLPSGFLKRLAVDKKRNLQIIRRLLNLPRGSPTLVYACTVKHAYFLSVILTAKGRKAGAISADTPDTVRRGLIRDFKESKFEFLCNFGVLTTGFDAPKTECIALCRPTMSPVLYEQIIGRGLRGPKFGGTTDCTIIDFADNIIRLGPPLAYARFDHLWNDEKKEGKW